MARYDLTWERDVERLSNRDGYGVGLILRRDGERLGLILAAVSGPDLRGTGQSEDSRFWAAVASLGAAAVREAIEHGDGPTEYQVAAHEVVVPASQARAVAAAESALPDAPGDDPFIVFDA